jgi:oxalate decarboxylase/phosphoglucose isomerase-like protein (cupin superfamily)
MSANWRQKIDPRALPTVSFDWGLIKWFVTPDAMPGAKLTFGEVVLLPGLGHDRHNHPDAEEILYILSGEGAQMVDDGEPFPVKAGDVIYIPTAIYHSTFNTGWQPLRLLALYNPGGSEKTLAELPDYHAYPAGEAPRLTRQ